jgi:xylan 1,4-beta-xylosidase
VLASKIVMEASGLVSGYGFWTFSDIFSENYFPSVPFQGGFGLLSIHGIPKPVYRAFELLHHLGTELLDVEGSHETVNAWVVRKKDGATILLTNHAMPRHPIQTGLLNLRIANAPEPRVIYIERIDEDHANPRRLWQAMGEPLYLNALQVERLKAASCLEKQPQPWKYEQQNINLSISLPSHAVAAITIEFV